MSPCFYWRYIFNNKLKWKAVDSHLTFVGIQYMEEKVWCIVYFMCACFHVLSLFMNCELWHTSTCVTACFSQHAASYHACDQANVSIYNWSFQVCLPHATVLYSATASSRDLKWIRAQRSHSGTSSHLFYAGTLPKTAAVLFKWWSWT